MGLISLKRVGFTSACGHHLYQSCPIFSVPWEKGRNGWWRKIRAWLGSHQVSSHPISSEIPPEPRLFNVVASVWPSRHWHVAGRARAPVHGLRGHTDVGEVPPWEPPCLCPTGSSSPGKSVSAESCWSAPRTSVFKSFFTDALLCGGFGIPPVSKLPLVWSSCVSNRHQPRPMHVLWIPREAPAGWAKEPKTRCSSGWCQSTEIQTLTPCRQPVSYIRGSFPSAGLHL